MKWTTKRVSLASRLGEERRVSVLCWFPRRFDSTWYWLQHVDVVQVVEDSWPSDFNGEVFYRWRYTRVYSAEKDTHL